MEVGGEPQYEVDSLLWHRALCGGTSYLVRWTGSGPEHDEWLHQDELGHARSILEQQKRADGLI